MLLHVTDREVSIIREILQGKTNPEIAKALNISVITVKFYISELLKKTHCHTRVQLILYLLEDPEGKELKKLAQASKK